VKPFNYALFLEQPNNTLATIVPDTPISYPLANGNYYTPLNYDFIYRGNTSVRRSLANSLNIPSVKALNISGVDNFIEFIKKFGVTTWNRNDYGLSLSLGSAEVNMTEWNQAFAVFANGGNLVKTSPIRYILTSSGDVLEYNPCIYSKERFNGRKILNDPGTCAQRAISEANAFLIKSVLNDNPTRSEVFGVNNLLNLPGTGAKTGTTNDLKDNWTMGFNNEYTVGVWVGNNDGTPMSNVASGITGAAPIWNRVISQVTNTNNSIDILNSTPEDVIRVNTCAYTGTLACNWCGGNYEYFIKGTEPQFACQNRIYTPPNNNNSDSD